MAAYYTAEQIARHGVIAIALRDVQAICDETASLPSPDVAGLLAPSVYAPTPEKRTARAAQYARYYKPGKVRYLRCRNYVDILRRHGH